MPSSFKEIGEGVDQEGDHVIMYWRIEVSEQTGLVLRVFR